ncbi:hypothetical protein AB0I10_38740 [Streptomyces sp. NPDC050636]|uniref:hypothetical protein n=1 Tax=Streptomyces sp. NPDC050636 TaxID=3154510 RepID=UPI00342B4F50
MAAHAAVLVPIGQLVEGRHDTVPATLDLLAFVAGESVEVGLDVAGQGADAFGLLLGRGQASTELRPKPGSGRTHGWARNSPSGGCPAS